MPARTIGFASMLVVTMTASTFALFAVAVVASELQAEFDISKLQVGLLGAVNTGVGGVFAPATGRLSDRLGGRTAMGAVLGVSCVGSALAGAKTPPTMIQSLWGVCCIGILSRLNGGR